MAASGGKYCTEINSRQEPYPINCCTGCGIWTFRSSALSFPGAKTPQMELPFPWHFRSLEHSLPWSRKSKNVRSTELSHPWNFRFSGSMSQEHSLHGTFAPILKKIGGSITAMSAYRHKVVGLRACVERCSACK